MYKINYYEEIMPCPGIEPMTPLDYKTEALPIELTGRKIVFKIQVSNLIKKVFVMKSDSNLFIFTLFIQLIQLNISSVSKNSRSFPILLKQSSLTVTY